MKIPINPVRYKFGYGYVVVGGVLFDLDAEFAKYWRPNGTHSYKALVFLTVGHQGEPQVRIAEGYAWHGARCCLDVDSVMRAGLLHDALYQMIREGVIDYRFRKLADRQFRRMIIADGFPRVFAWIAYAALRMFARKAATTATESHIQFSPVRRKS